MKFPILLLLLAAFTLTGCNAQTVERRMDSIEDTIENVIDPEPTHATSSTAATSSTSPTSAQTSPSEPAISKEQAQAIALEHAGFTEDQVSYLYTHYEIDDGVAEYEVEFHYERWEYDYEINAETGDIISFSRDD